MPNSQQPSMGGFPEHNESRIQPMDATYPRLDDLQGQTRLASLLEAGLMWEEAVKLMTMRENLYENEEVRQRMAEDYRMHFARWLLEHGEISEA